MTWQVQQSKTYAPEENTFVPISVASKLGSMSLQNHGDETYNDCQIVPEFLGTETNLIKMQLWMEKRADCSEGPVVSGLWSPDSMRELT